MTVLLHPILEFLVSRLRIETGSSVKEGEDRKPCERCIMLTSYLPSFERGPFGGIERLKAMRVAGEANPAMMLSFQSLETLTAHPENSILLEEGCSYVRLPSDLRKSMPINGQSPLSEIGLRKVVLRSCTVTGQLTAFVDRLVQDLQGKGLKRTFHRHCIGGLLSFCRKHFHGWFQPELEILQHPQALDSPSALEALTSIRSLAGSASVYTHLAKLQHGKSFDIINSGLGPMRMMALNAERGLITKEAFAEYLRQTPQLTDFANRLRAVCDEFTAAVELANNLPPQLEKNVRNFVGAAAILSSPSTTSNFTGSPARLVSAIDELQDALTDVRELICNTNAH
jgi:hypothetical protein